MTLSFHSKRRPPPSPGSQIVGLYRRPKPQMSIHHHGHPQQQQGEETVEDLRAENGFLEDQLQRCIKELKAYQNQAKLNNTNNRACVRSQAESMPDLPAMKMSAAAMTPLAAAYDARIEELEQLNQLQAEKLECLAGRAEVLVLENEDLHQAAFARAERRCKSNNRQERPDDDFFGENHHDLEFDDEEEEEEEEEGEGNLALALGDATVAELVQQSGFLRAENAVLLEQADLAGLELSRASQALAEKDVQIDELLQELMEAGPRLQEQQQELAALRQAQVEQHEEQRQRGNSATVAVKEALQETRAALAAAEERSHSLEEHLREAQQSAHSREVQWTQKYNDLVARCQNAETCIPNLRAQLTAAMGEGQRSRALLEEAEASRAELTEVTAALEATQQDAAEMVRVMEELQAQVEAYEAREEEVTGMAARCREQAQEAVRQREEASQGEAQARRELRRVLEAQQEAVSDLEAEVEVKVARGKAQLVKQYERREQELKEEAERTARLRVEVEQVGWDKRRSDTLYSELCAVVKDEQGGVRQHLLDLTRRLTESEVARGKAEAEATTLAQEKRQFRHGAAAREDKWAHAKRRLEEHRARDGEVKAVREQLATVEGALGSRTREVARLQRQREKSEAAWQVKVEGLQESYQQQAEAAALKLLKTEAALREQDPAISDFQARHARILQRIRTEHKGMIDELHRGLWDEREALQRANQEKEALLSQLTSTTHELNVSKQQLARLRQDLQTTTQQVSELSGQLSDSLGTQQRLAKDEARLRAQLKGKKQQHWANNERLSSCSAAVPSRNVLGSSRIGSSSNIRSSASASRRRAEKI